jgi:hypothetical protein
MRCQDDGAVRNQCRVLCKNSNDSTARQRRDDVFVVKS